MNTNTNFKDFINNMNRKSFFIILLTILVIILLILIKTNLIESFDTSIYNLLSPSVDGAFTGFFKAITFLAEAPVVSGFCVLAVIISVFLKKRNIGLTILGCVLFNFIISEIIKKIIQRPRPEILQMVHETSYSFPSGHTLASTSLCGILIYFILKSGLSRNMKTILTVPLVLVPILVAISRVYLGVHYPSDVLGGGLIAVILLLIEISIIEKKELF